MLTQFLSNDLCFPANNLNGLDQSLNLESLGSLFTRLILQNHLTRLAGDTLGLGGRGVWSCSIPPPSCAQPNVCSPPPPPPPSSSPSSCPAHPRGCGQQWPSCGGRENVCGHTNNNINICHTCPAATVPYIINNVFVIPALHQQQCAGAVGSGHFGSFNLNHNNLSSGSGNGISGLGGGMGGLATNTGNPTFHCRGCGLQIQ